MEDHGAREAGQGGGRVRIGVARVDHDSGACCRRDLELAVEEHTLDGARREIVEVVETRLPDRDGPRMAQQLDELIDTRSLRAARLMRVDPERRRRRPPRPRRSRARRGTTGSPSRS